MSLDRRRFLRSAASCAALGLAAPALAQSYGQSFRVDSDEGRPLANMRLPGELTERITELRGVTYVGTREADVTLYEFFDYNCPYCRKAALDIEALVSTDASLRVGLVNNPILSVMSAQAAKVALAVQKTRGSAAAFRLYAELLKTPGRIDGPKALEVAQGAGLQRAELERVGDSDAVRDALRAQIRMANDLGLNATPSYVLGNIGVLGHPGPKSLAGMIAAMRRCDRIACG